VRDSCPILLLESTVSMGMRSEGRHSEYPNACITPRVFIGNVVSNFGLSR
jgi:hypothetical protein